MGEQKLTNVKNVLLRNARGEDQGLVDSCFDCWAQEVKRSQKEGDSQQALNELNRQLNQFKGDQANKRKSVMARMGAGQDSGLIAITFNSWLQFHSNYKKDKEFEDAVKRSETAIAAHMKR